MPRPHTTAPILFILLGLLSLLLSSCASSFSHVVLDAGHGGHDRGASRAGIHEKHLALDISLRVAKILREDNIPVTLTRSRDNYITLNRRSEIANRIPDSALVSIHFNSASRRSARGIETFHYPSASSGSVELAHAIQNRLIRYTDATDRGVKTANFSVLRETHNVAVLVECGFLSNSADRDQSLQSDYRDRLARAIADGIKAEISF